MGGKGPTFAVVLRGRFWKHSVFPSIAQSCMHKDYSLHMP